MSADPVEPYDYCIHAVGSLDYGVKDGQTGNRVFTTSNGTRDAIGAFEYCRDNPHNSGPGNQDGNVVLLAPTRYPISRSLVLSGSTFSNQNQSWGSLFGSAGISGAHQSIVGPSIEPTGNWEAIIIDNSSGQFYGSGISLHNLSFIHNVTGYSKNMLQLKNQSVFTNLDGLSFYDNLKFAAGSGALGIYFDNGTNNGWFNRFHRFSVRGFENAINFNFTVTTTPPAGYFNSNSFAFWDVISSKRMVAIVSPASSGWALAENDFYYIHHQWDTANNVGSGGSIWDLETGNSVICGRWRFMHCINWDMPSGVTAFKLKATDGIELIGTHTAYSITGAGATDYKTAYKSTSVTNRDVIATFNGDGVTRDFVVTHSLTYGAPTHALVTPLSTDAIDAAPVGVIAQTTTTVTVRFKKPPRTGTNNISLSVRVSIQ
jgi:hypothetical protein